MSKQDRVYTRTAADLERKQNVRKSFSEVMGVVNETRGVATGAMSIANNAMEEANAPANNLDIGFDDRLIFESYEELNTFVEDLVPKMGLDTQKIVGATFGFELFGYGTITFAVGLNGNGEANALVSIMVDGQHLYRQAYSDGYGEDGIWDYYWHKRDGSEDNGEWSHFGAVSMRDGMFEELTGDRYNGKPVYIKLVDLGTLPNKASISVPFTTESCTVVSFEAYATRTADNYMRSLPFFNNSGGCEAVVSINHASKSVEVKTLYDYSGYTGKAILKYIKDEAVI